MTAVIGGDMLDAVKAMPNLHHVIIGNEPNLNLFWLPQFGTSGQDVAAVDYERLLARTYDAVKRVAPDVEVLGGARLVDPVAQI